MSEKIELSVISTSATRSAKPSEVEIDKKDYEILRKYLGTYTFNWYFINKNTIKYFKNNEWKHVDFKKILRKSKEYLENKEKKEEEEVDGYGKHLWDGYFIQTLETDHLINILSYLEKQIRKERLSNKRKNYNPMIKIKNHRNKIEEITEELKRREES